MAKFIFFSRTLQAPTSTQLQVCCIWVLRLGQGDSMVMISSRNCLLKFPVETWNFPPKIPPDYKTSYCICLSKCVQECLEKYMFVKLLITTFVIDRSSMLSTHAPKAFQVNYCLFKLAPKLLKEFLFPFRRLFIKRILGTPDIGALIKYFPRFQIILWKKLELDSFYVVWSYQEINPR